ncbi:MAG TPA: DUF4915 domain-containing protein [Chloroflexaceae bacterium]|nr:DUF4915 domain-containing protein [Chloroflexaceae bacterium]
MTSIPLSELDALWARHHAEWRDQAQITSQWREAAQIDPKLLAYSVQGRWWEVLAEAGITLLVSREYEHLLMGLCATERGPRVSYMPMPHPSGLAVDHERGVVHVASTRNPNQIYDLKPVTDVLRRTDMRGTRPDERPLVPVRSHFLPGSLYIHDLALIGGRLHANAVGHNAVVSLDHYGGYERVWWPRAIERAEGPIFDLNHLQLNSIAAGPNLAGSYFSASTDRVSARRPGHKNFPVKGRGVIFSGATREPLAYGLTRPHSARLHGGRLWVDNSGYGELCVVEGERCPVVAALPGWTRGLCFHGHIAFVGTSRVIPRFRQYAPGLDVDASRCGLHAVDTRSGAVLGSLYWPYGNQIFALDWADRHMTAGFPFTPRGKRGGERERGLFYTFQVEREHR